MKYAVLYMHDVEEMTMMPVILSLDTVELADEQF